MDWIEITVTVPTEKTEEAAAIANMTVPYGIYIEDYSDLEQGALEIAHVDLIDELLLSKRRDITVIHIYAAESENASEVLSYLGERLCAVGIPYETGVVTVDDCDWNENWKKYFKAFPVGKRLAVCPSWGKYDNKENRTVIKLDPGAAFGTGAHATTYLCLQLLEEYVTPQKTLLDIGTGSGILTIAAALLGAKESMGIDIDELSVKTARENAERNGVSKVVSFEMGDLAESVSGRYDIVCANIVADVIIRLFESAAEYMKDNGVLMVSGIIDIRASEVERAAAQHGFKIVKSLERDEWHAYVLMTSGVAKIKDFDA